MFGGLFFWGIIGGIFGVGDVFWGIFGRENWILYMWYKVWLSIIIILFSV